MTIALVPTEADIKAITFMATNANKSKLFSHIKDEAAAFCIMLRARELGIPLMEAMCGGIQIIQGNVEISPRTMNSMIRKAGHPIHILKDDGKECVLKGIRKDTGETYECSYTMVDAQAAGNSNKDNYRKYGSDMLFARCMSRLARRLFADVIGTAYVEGEISDSQDPPDNKYPNVEIETVLTDEQKEQLSDLIVQINDKDYLSRLGRYLNAPTLLEIKSEKYEEAIKYLKHKIIKTPEKEEINESVAPVAI
jgi:hypothetical protein